MRKNKFKPTKKIFLLLKNDGKAHNTNVREQRMYERENAKINADNQHMSTHMNYF